MGVEGSPNIDEQLPRLQRADMWARPGNIGRGYAFGRVCVSFLLPLSLAANSFFSPSMLSTKVYSLFDDVPPRSPVPKFVLPDCYQVKNVQPIEAKISSFNEETLMWILYSCP